MLLRLSILVALWVGGSENVLIKMPIIESGCSVTYIELLTQGYVCVCCFQGAICCRKEVKPHFTASQSDVHTCAPFLV